MKIGERIKGYKGGIDGIRILFSRIITKPNPSIKFFAEAT